MPSALATLNWGNAPAFGRRARLLNTLRRVHAFVDHGACIVETGTTRDSSPEARNGDGWSTVAWGWYCSQAGGRVYTVDCDPAAIEVCKRLTKEYAEQIEYVCSD